MRILSKQCLPLHDGGASEIKHNFQQLLHFRDKATRGGNPQHEWQFGSHSCERSQKRDGRPYRFVKLNGTSSSDLPVTYPESGTKQIELVLREIFQHPPGPVMHHVEKGQIPAPRPTEKSTRGTRKPRLSPNGETKGNRRTEGSRTSPSQKAAAECCIFITEDEPAETVLPSDGLAVRFGENAEEVRLTAKIAPGSKLSILASEHEDKRWAPQRSFKSRNVESDKFTQVEDTGIVIELEE